MADRPRYTSHSRFGPTREWETLRTVGARSGSHHIHTARRLVIAVLCLGTLLIAAAVIRVVS